MEWILFLVGGLVAGAIVGFALGLATGWSRWGRRRRARAIAVDAELQAARQRAERAAGEAQALRTRLVTAEVLAGRASALEADLASARQEAAWNADQVAQLEAELAALDREPVVAGVEAAWGAPMLAEPPANGVAVGALVGAGSGGGGADAAVADAPPRRAERRTRVSAPVMAVGVEPTTWAEEVGSAPAAVEIEPVATWAAEPAWAAEPEPVEPELVEPAWAAEPEPVEPEAAEPEPEPALTAEPEPAELAVPARPASPGPADPNEPGSEPGSEPDFRPIRPGLSDPRLWLGSLSPAGIPYAEDDLQQIHGIGPYLARRLREQGIRTWRQIAEWDEDDMTFASKLIGSFPDRIRREDWVGSARVLHEQLYGERLP